MKTLRLLAILLILAFSLSLFTACDVLEELMGSTTGDVTDNGDNTAGTDGPDAEKPGEDNNKPGEDNNDDAPLEHIHSWVDGVCPVCGDACEHWWNNGECTVCGVSCDHDFDENEKCSICGVILPTPPMEECKHEWSCGVCTLCGYECEHDFVDGTSCSICDVQVPVPPECKHEWADGVCIHCEEICSHVFSGDACEICGFINVVEPPLDDCQHAWENGVCQSCGKVCEHDFGLDVNCHICGELLPGYYILVTYKENEYKVRYEITLGEFISEYLGTTYEETVANGAYWMTVDWNYEKVTLEKDSYFMNCGMVLELYLIGGAMPPSPECEHEWVDDYCPKCGITCQHSFTDSVCTICGKVCDHSWWTSGECGWCGLPCDHEWDGNWCVKCSFTCMHEGTRVDGVCTVCGDVCNHYWILDRCENCGMVCNHTFDGPTCTKCGYMSGGIDNPIIVTYEGQDYYIQYSASFELFLQQCLAMDYHETVLNGYWVALTHYGEVTLGEYTAMSDFAPSVTIEFRANDIGGGDGPVNPADCAHNFLYGTCEWCGMPCPHDEWKDRWCAYCGYECFHTGWYGGVCDFCGYTCQHDFENGYCMMCNFHANEIEGTLTVYYEGMAYEVPLGTTVSQFVNHYLYMDFEMSTYTGFWNLRTDADSIPVGSETYFCDYEGDLYLEYTAYAMGGW